jgi:hypothetical protein
VWRRENFLDLHPLHAVAERLAIDLVTLAQEVGRRGVVRERVYDLLSVPESGGVLGDVEVDDAAAMVGEHDEDEEDAEPSGGHREEINRDQVPDVIGQERPPGLRRRGAAARPDRSSQADPRRALTDRAHRATFEVSSVGLAPVREDGHEVSAV